MSQQLELYGGQILKFRSKLLVNRKN